MLWWNIPPSMPRMVAEIEVLEWSNGDGYQNNVLVCWHNSEIVCPKTWIWQDTRKILAYSVGLSENNNSINLNLMDLI